MSDRDNDGNKAQPPGERRRWLRVARKAAGLTQDKLARKIGRSKSAITQWESGQRSPGPQAVPQLAEALKMTPREVAELIDKTKGSEQ
jgi:transcriptional regulator with XRE-family HTH domain